MRGFFYSYSYGQSVCKSQRAALPGKRDDSGMGLFSLEKMQIVNRTLCTVDFITQKLSSNPTVHVHVGLARFCF